MGYMSPISTPSPFQSESILSGYVDCLALPPAQVQEDEDPRSIRHDWKLCYARRALKQRAWDALRGRARSQSSASESSKPLVSNIKFCCFCGERFGGGKDATECIFHSGEFLPRSSVPGRSLDHLGNVV